MSSTMNALVTAFVSGITGLGVLVGIQISVQAQDWRACRQHNERFSEVFAFATRNYYINICSDNGQYYYLGQSRLNPFLRLTLPIQQVETGDYFAENGDYSYSVTDLRGVAGAPGAFKLTVTHRYPNGHVVTMLDEAATQYFADEAPSTMCNPVVESC
jgi:hypothetical protein